MSKLGTHSAAGLGRRSLNIFITAFDSPALKEQALQRRGAAYLTKPFEGTGLLETIQEVTLFRA
jgi:CheY-like chemotaxis protein